VLPVLPSLAAAVRPGGHAIFSGLLVSERAEVEAALAAVGLRVCGEREEPDPSGDAWLGLVTRR
jgi:ribosomal protein L11 methylase PrmA